MTMHFTEAFKEQAVKKALARDNKTLKQVAKELNVGYSTLQKWIRHSGQNNSSDKSTLKWTPEAKLQALMDTHGLDEQARNQYCRQHGLFAHQLVEWRETLLQSSVGSSETDKQELKRLKEENKLLSKQLGRKEKALAEAAALLVLQKKFNSLWEDQEK
jgi:transposase-like protein